uniref:Crystaline entomocidal protoxin n=1 Tax=Bacillus thuringiensis TaxID=1428 RepID=A0A1Q1NKN6_BACTU|nr:Cry32Ea-like protein [Bacillus thuringiensis]
MDYKELMNKCEWGESGELFADELGPVRDLLIISTGIGWALLGFVPGIGPVLSAVAGVLNVAIPYLWPEDAGDPGTPQAQISWDKMMTAAEQITNKAIAEQARAQAITELQGIQAAIRLYRDAACNWEKNPNNPQLKETVRTQFVATNTILYNRMPYFSARGSETSLLTAYVEAATLHLGLLKDAARFGLQWGMDPSIVNVYYGYLTNNIATYTNHCTRWYNTGLQQQYNTGDWNKFNNFRRNMTMAVLDIVAVWPTFDIKLYEVPTKSQLTRTVYTPLEGNVGGNWLSPEPVPSIDVIEGNIVDTPGLFKWLHNISFEAIDGGVNTSVIKGRGIKYRYTLRDLIIDGGYQGERGTKKETLPVTLPVGSEDRYLPVGNVWHVTNQLFSSGGASVVTGWLFRGMEPDLLSAIPVFWDINSSYNSSSGLPCRGMNSVCETCDPNCMPEIPSGGSICDRPSQYGNRLSYVGLGMLNSDYRDFVSSPTRYAAYIGYGWTHVSADENNQIYPNMITQIPAVKGYITYGNASVVKGPGSTGGDLVKLPVPEGRTAALGIPFTHPFNDTSLIKSYNIRLRYASNADVNVFCTLQKFTDDGDIEEIYEYYTLPATSSDNSLSYNSFGYYNLSGLELNIMPGYERIHIYNEGGGDLILDKIEFIPIEGTLEEYQANQDLEKAKKAVNALFKSDAKNTLQLNVTDYLVDQAAKLVECMSDEIYPQEKMCLLDLVKVAKRLSQARNLLKYGDFDSDNWSGENGWKTSSNVSVRADDPIFKGRYLHMPGANIPQFSDTVFPTYAYQKIDESKLKPYTRYMVRGFVGNSKELEVFVQRYDKEIHKNMNVPYGIPPTNPCDRDYQRTYPVLTNQTIPQDMACDSCDAGTVMRAKQTLVKCEDPHAFMFHMDTGELDTNQNLGIWVGFKIGTTDGVANIDNLEVIEANPLTGEALARVKKREHKWKQKWTEKRTKIEKAVQAAQSAIQALFTDQNQTRLRPDITLNHILHAETLVQKIPYVYHPFLQGSLPAVPGETYDIFQQLSNAIGKARSLYGQRNVLRNGDFSAGLSNWQGAEGALVQKIGNASVLVLSNWSANLSQNVCVNPAHGYILRVTARKEGAGEGYVTISDGTEDNTETVKFTAGVETPRLTQSDMRSPIQEGYKERNMTNQPSEVSGTNAYPGNNNRNYQSESFGITPYSDETTMMNGPSNNYEASAYRGSRNMTNNGVGCGCGCGTNAYTGENMMMNDSSNYNGAGYGCSCRTHTNNRMDSYVSTSLMTAQNGSPLSGYVTKTVEIFPETNHVCIEIGETAGTFKLESIELIRMDCE